MATKIPHLKTKNAITLIFGGKTHLIAKQDERFERVLLALSEGRDSDIPDIVDAAIGLKRAGLDVDEGIITLNGEQMPTELNARILEYKRDGLPFGSLANFWKNLQQNPSYNSRQQLFKFLENKGHPITEDGFFIGYRGVRKDFKDKHSGTFDNSVGSHCEIPRHLVDDNPNNTCSFGLHVGSYDYAKDFGSGGAFIMVKVNPKDVVSVPNDYNGQKMRVCAFDVIAEAKDMLDTPVVNAKGGKELTLKDEANSASGKAFKSDDLTAPGVKLLTAKQKRAHAKRYSNNHAKRDKNGKFVSKKSNSKRSR